MVFKKILRILKNARRFHYRRFEDESSLLEEQEEEPVGPPEVPNVPSKESQMEDLISFTDISMTQQNENKEERQEEPVGPSEAPNVSSKESEMEDLISFTDISMTQQNKNEEERQEEPVGPPEVPNVPSEESQMEDLISFTDISMTQQHENEEDILIATFQSQIQAWEDEKLENENQDDFLLKLLSQENTNLEKEIQRVQQSVQSFGSLEQQSRNDSSELQLLRQRNAELRAELEALQRKEEEIKFQNALLKNDIKSETEEGLTLENQLCKLKRQYSQGLMENSKTKSELNALQKTNTDLLE
ncbi:trichohyalin-like, partial [Oryzias melastigma]|uniref:trichohyalin-like n=1 Tax=Oryzias melastigma TaxID=30732 RepID=UPI000CF7D1DF